MDDLTMRSERMQAAARIRDLELELAEARAQIEAKDAALADLLSWFPDKPSEPQWQLSAGVYGADAAIAAAREALAKSAQETE